MNIYYNAEYTGPNKHSVPISMGFVAETGERLYIEFTNVPSYLLSDYHKEQILPNLTIYSDNIDQDIELYTKENISYWYVGDEGSAAFYIKSWLESLTRKEDERLVLVTYCGHYDAVMFFNLFHTIALPDCVSKVCYDVVSQIVNPKHQDNDLSSRMYEVLTGEATSSARDKLKSSPLPENALKYAEMIKYIYHNM